MDIEAMQPETASSVTSADNVSQQTEGASSTNGGMKTSWVWAYVLRLREKAEAAFQVPKLCGGSAIFGSHICTAMNGTNNLAKNLMSKHQIHGKLPEQGAMRAYWKSGNLKVRAS